MNQAKRGGSSPVNLLAYPLAPWAYARPIRIDRMKVSPHADPMSSRRAVHASPFLASLVECVEALTVVLVESVLRRVHR